MPKSIVVFSDGTGQDGGARPEQRISNIYKMYRISRDHADTGIDPSKQVVFYDAGLGTDVGTTALTAPVRFVQKLLGSVTGAGIKRNIADCYEFIIDHYEDGDGCRQPAPSHATSLQVRTSAIFERRADHLLSKKLSST